VSKIPGWDPVVEGLRAGIIERQQRGPKARPVRSENQRLKDAREAYEYDMGRKVDGYGQRIREVPADQWLEDARKSTAHAGELFESLFDKAEE
jgi:hypothetical protein